jgi:hypothetical protein
MRTAIIILPVLALSLVLGACDAKKTAEDRATEQAAKAMGADKVDVSTNADGSKNVSISKDGTTVQTGADIPLPDGFPKDVPSYPGWKIATAASAPGQGFMLQARSGDKMERIARFYSDRMTGEGWKNSGTTQMPEMHLLSFEKSGRQAAVVLTLDNEHKSETIVQVTASN